MQAVITYAKQQYISPPHKICVTNTFCCQTNTFCRQTITFHSYTDTYTHRNIHPPRQLCLFETMQLKEDEF